MHVEHMSILYRSTDLHGLKFESTARNLGPCAWDMY